MLCAFTRFALLLCVQLFIPVIMVILQFCSVPPVSFFCNVPPCTVFSTSRIRVELSLVVHFFFQSQFTAVDFRSVDCLFFMY